MKMGNSMSEKNAVLQDTIAKLERKVFGLEAELNAVLTAYRAALAQTKGETQ